MKYPKNTYDFNELKVCIDDEKPLVNITMFLENNNEEVKTISYRIQPKLFNNIEDIDVICVKEYFNILCVYKYLKENNIQSELLNEIKNAIIPKLNEQGVREDLDKDAVNEVYDKCCDLDLFSIKEVQDNFSNAHNFCEKNNKALDRKNIFKKAVDKVKEIFD